MTDFIEKKEIAKSRVGEVFDRNNKYAFRIYINFVGDEKTHIQERSGFTTKALAKKERDETIGQLYNNNFIIENKKTVSEYLLWWLEYFRANNGKSYQTYKTYGYNIKNHLIPKIGKVKLSKVTRGMLIDAISRIAKDASYSVAKMSIVVLKASMSNAQTFNLINSDCYSNLEIPKKIKKESKPYRMRIIDSEHTPSVEECAQILVAAKGSKIFLHLLFAITLGLRRGEILGLKYEDVDFEHNKLHIQRQLGQKLDEDTGKELRKQEVALKTFSSDRVLNLPDFVCDIIKTERVVYEINRKRRPSAFNDEGYICCSTYGKPRSPSYHAKKYKEILDELNLPSYRFHDLRNAYATLLSSNEFSLKAISKALGHATEIVTDEHYINKKTLRLAITQKMDGVINELIPNSPNFEEEKNDVTVNNDTNYEISVESYIV